MELFKIKSPTPWRMLNIWNKTYTFDKDCICLLPEQDIVGLPNIYINLWKMETKVEDFQEIKKIVVEPKKEIEKVIETEKVNITKVKK